MTTQLPGGWVIQQVQLDDKGNDKYNWHWGVGKSLWHCSDDLESVTVRADTEAEAVAEMAYAGWPPKTLRRLGWEYTS